MESDAKRARSITLWRRFHCRWLRFGFLGYRVAAARRCLYRFGFLVSTGRMRLIRDGNPRRQPLPIAPGYNGAEPCKIDDIVAIRKFGRAADQCQVHVTEDQQSTAGIMVLHPPAQHFNFGFLAHSAHNSRQQDHGSLIHNTALPRYFAFNGRAFVFVEMRRRANLLPPVRTLLGECGKPGRTTIVPC